MPRYNPATIEPKWQQYWDANRTFETPKMPSGEKMYVLDMFPYPSGDGLHVGHPEGYTATDIVCRYKRMRGVTVMHPMGFDSFGLPAEEAAINKGVHPREFTEKNIANFRRQLKMLGFSYDWSRELATTDPEYFRWTQFIFLVLFDTWFDEDWEEGAGSRAQGVGKEAGGGGQESAAQTPDTRPPDHQTPKRRGKGRPISELPIPESIQAAGEEAIRRYQDSKRLAYQHEAPVNWCPALGTVLANEEVMGGLSERGNHPVVRIPLRQWMLRITAYADRLENDLELVDWPHSIKKLQSDWIGRSTGAEVDFFVDGAQNPLPRGEGRSPQATRRGEVRGSEPNDPPMPTNPNTPSASDFEAWRDSRKQSGFPPDAPQDVLRIFTTRPDTLFGATYMVIAPEHPFVERLTTSAQQAAVKEYCEAAARKSDLDRTELSKTKTGVFTGSYAINPVNGAAVPIWIADYVLISYGTGAIMAVPAHDERDFEFAKAFKLPIVAVVKPAGQMGSGEWGMENDGGDIAAPFVGDGESINSGSYNYLSTPEFKLRIITDLANNGLGLGAVNYKLRDWLFSRQRFWGEPFPILHELDANGKPTGLLRAVPADQLPVNLPELADFKPIGEPKPPLEKAPAEWLYLNVEKAEGGRRKAETSKSESSLRPAPCPLPPGTYKRETNTMPQWAGSCWYYLRFLDNKNDKTLVDPAIEKAWMPVDLYIGGAEHAVLHLLYSRFWHKVLFDRGYVSSPEPFTKLVNQGMILGEMEFTGFQGAGCSWVSAADVKFDDNNVPHNKKTGEKLKSCRVEPGDIEKQGDVFVFKMDPSIRVDSRAYKMSKSRGNVVNPDQVVKEYGADALRLYEMFMGPLEATKPWSMTGVSGVRNFLDRVWRLIVNDRAEGIELSPGLQKVAPTDDQNRVLHKTIAAVTKDLDHLDFNTAIARMMEFTNFFTKETIRPVEAMEKLVLLLAPFAPHLAEELWQILGHGKTLAYEPWPKVDERWLKEDTVEVPVQINGKLRGKITVPTGSDQAALEAAAKADERIAQQLASKTIVKAVIVPGRLVNFVVK